MKNELQDYLGRPKRYDNIDGTGEMLMGLMMLGFTLLGYLNAVLPENSMWRHGLAGMLLMPAVLLPVLGSGYWGAKAIKKHITWPRTGYMALGGGGKSRRTTMAALSALAAGIAGISAFGIACLMRFESQHDWISLAWMGNAAIFVAAYAFWIYRMEKDRPWKWLVLLFMVLGILAIAFIAPGDIVGWRWLMLSFIGLTWLGSGGASLYLYIRHTQPPAPEAE
jgi:drug/metabolite transporter (DMT)-like permease